MDSFKFDKKVNRLKVLAEKANYLIDVMIQNNLFAIDPSGSIEYLIEFSEHINIDDSYISIKYKYVSDSFETIDKYSLHEDYQFNFEDSKQLINFVIKACNKGIKDYEKIEGVKINY